jgi:peptidyl-prolyl cis-trans isomerase B (cyclophilin B)
MTEQVILKTTLGEIHIALDEAKAPKTVANFLKYLNKKHYDGTIFHRVIDNFMIQGGGMNEKLEPRRTDDPIENEADNGLTNEVGTIAMARTQDPHSASCQFFINVADNAFLNHTAKTPDGWGYTVFGKVTAGLDVVQRIAKTETGNQGHYQDVPTSPIYIDSVTQVTETTEATQ